MDAVTFEEEGMGLRRQKSDNMLGFQRKASLVRERSNSQILMQRGPLNHTRLEVPKVVRAIH